MIMTIDIIIYFEIQLNIIFPRFDIRLNRNEQQHNL